MENDDAFGAVLIMLITMPNAVIFVLSNVVIWVSNKRNKIRKCKNDR